MAVDLNYWHEEDGSLCLDLSGRRAERWLSALGALRIPSSLGESRGLQVLRVAPDWAESALAEIRRLEMDLNSSRWQKLRQRRSDRVQEAPLAGPVWVAVVSALLIIHLMVGDIRQNHEVFTRADVAAGAVQAGDWWRCITALCLHADLSHWAGNTAGFLFFGYALSRQAGEGVAALLVLLAGFLGNLSNSWLHGFEHRCIGASTATFAIIGLLCASSYVRRHQGGEGWRSWTLPILVAVAMFFLTGIGPGIDVGAHALGMIWGAILGRLSAPWWPRAAVMIWPQAAALISAALLLKIAWTCAGGLPA
ncbi:MAG: hypothetical protein RL095_3390 [Verrucomicrobiota bacterium]|jgi:membrane associated rhomboid family serine protease